MLVSHVDTAHHVIALPDHPHFLGCLDEIEWLRRCQQLPGNAARIAGRLGGKRKSALAGQHLVVRLLHLPRRPGLEHRVLGVADVRRHLAGAIPVAMERIGGVLPDRAAAQSRRRVQPIDAQGEPGKLGRSQMRNLAFGRFLVLGRSLRKRGRAGRKKRNDRDESRGRGAAPQHFRGIAMEIGTLIEPGHHVLHAPARKLKLPIIAFSATAGQHRGSVR